MCGRNKDGQTTPHSVLGVKRPRREAEYSAPFAAHYASKATRRLRKVRSPSILRLVALPIPTFTPGKWVWGKKKKKKTAYVEFQPAFINLIGIPRIWAVVLLHTGHHVPKRPLTANLHWATSQNIEDLQQWSNLDSPVNRTMFVDVGTTDFFFSHSDGRFLYAYLAFAPLIQRLLYTRDKYGVVC